ncbi:uncharacterized protein LOC122377436 [Amphibalanus amphitrite]|uniref:uncharacterized protein LOC122377436 n=1 Tax=Amphibalanus amphitrite TaxID=1232801 RepID=UPI001C91E3D7|nr:uncharacterized protein LOC122377436 [Amphibalanus amphitrite]
MSQLERPSEFANEPNALWQMRLIGPRLSPLEGYRLIATQYDKDFDPENYAAPRLVCEALCRVFPENGRLQRCELRVMDVAAGTGLVGHRIHEEGFRNIDALDPCREMIVEAEKRGVYQNFIHDTIGLHQTEVAESTYDAVVIAGGFVQGHCPPEALDEMIRICKPGGYVINSMRYEYLVTVPEYHRLDRHMDDLEDAGKWRRVDRYVTDHYFFSKQGITYIYQKL